MVPKKKSTKSPEPRKVSSSDVYNDLFVCMAEPKEKRKYILQSIKNSLILQEEYDKIIEIRKQKTQTLNEIKKGMELLNKSYQSLKKLMPNVKNVISLTQEELHTLDSHIDLLNEDIHADKDNISIDKTIKHELTRPPESRVHESVEAKLQKVPVKVTARPQVQTKLDRIQNNLRVIEEKLKGL